uniref:Uncharacterized protein n=1 Tax=uncultured marine virus TaxID=186617 RepID=A0A0F7L7G8_9VIRU|nr:hypothetical protein [uncultured marine virus]
MNKRKTINKANWILITAIFIIIFVFAFNCAGQSFHKSKLILTPKSLNQAKKDNWKRLVMTVLSISLDAAGDALMDKGNKKAGHLLNAASVGATLLIFPICNMNKHDILKYGVEYVSIRFSMFDAVYNSTYGLPLTYSGNTSYFDEAIKNVPSHAKVTVKTITLCFALAWNSQEFNYIKRRR